jgi:hypothetical protein
MRSVLFALCILRCCAALGAICVIWRRAAIYLTRTRAQGGWTALICVSENGHSDCVRLLLDAGADMNAKTDVRVSVRRLSKLSHAPIAAREVLFSCIFVVPYLLCLCGFWFRVPSLLLASVVS